MTNLELAIASGQVSAAQIEAHIQAGELPIDTAAPLVEELQIEVAAIEAEELPIPIAAPVAPVLSAELMARYELATPAQRLREIIDGATGEEMHVFVRVSEVRAALDSLENVPAPAPATVAAFDVDASVARFMESWRAAFTQQEIEAAARREITAAVAAGQ